LAQAMLTQSINFLSSKANNPIHCPFGYPT